MNRKEGAYLKTNSSLTISIHTATSCSSKSCRPRGHRDCGPRCWEPSNVRYWGWKAFTVKQGITRTSDWRGSSGWKQEKLQNGITGPWVMNPHLVIRKDKIYQRHCPKTDPEKDKQCWHQILDGWVKWVAIRALSLLLTCKKGKWHKTSFSPCCPSAIGASGLGSKTPNDPKYC